MVEKFILFDTQTFLKNFRTQDTLKRKYLRKSDLLKYLLPLTTYGKVIKYGFAI